MKGVSLPRKATVGGVPSTVSSRSVPVTVAITSGGAWPHGGLEVELQALDAALRDDERTVAREADLLPEALQPRASRRRGGAALVPIAERLGLEPEVGHEIGGDLARDRSG